MTTTWTRPAAVLTAEASGWDGVWTLVYAAGQAAVNLSAVPGADKDLGLSYAALDVSYALTELELLGPDVVAIGVAVDLGSVALADRAAAVVVVDDLLAAAEFLAIKLVTQPDVAASAVLCVARVMTLLSSARAKATGGRVVTAPATYGDLMLRAAIGIQHGVVWVQNLPLERREFAETAIDDFRDVLRALKEHTWVLLETRRVRGIIASGAPDPRERAAVRMGGLLNEVVGPTSPWAWVGATVSP